MHVPAAVPGRPPPPPPLLLLLLARTALLLVGTTQGCVITAWSHGKLDESVLLDGGFTPAGPEYIRGSCHCCALCHHEPNCASLSYNSDGQCELYNTVANYTTLLPDLEEEWTYYVMPGRSKTGQFCRQDEDCVDGDACRGRFCTGLQLVTCRTICEQFGCIGNYSYYSEPMVYGWINNSTVKLVCWMPGEDRVYTRIFHNTRSQRFTKSNILEYNTQLSEDHREQSLLNLAETLRQSGDDNYRIKIWAWGCSSDPAAWDILEYKARGTETIVSDSPRTNNFDIITEHDTITSWSGNWRPTMLWMPTEKDVHGSQTLLSIASTSTWQHRGSLARNQILRMGYCDAKEVFVFINK